MEFFDVDREVMFQEICETGREEGIVDEGAYRDLVEDVIESHRRVGEMHDDSPTDSLAEEFIARFAEYKTSLSLDESQPQL